MKLQHFFLLATEGTSGTYNPYAAQMFLYYTEACRAFGLPQYFLLITICLQLPEVILE